MKRLLFSIVGVVVIYGVAALLLLAIGGLPGNGPNINVFENPFGFYSIAIAVGAMLGGAWIYWRILDPNRAARMARDRRSQQR